MRARRSPVEACRLRIRGRVHGGPSVGEREPLVLTERRQRTVLGRESEVALAELPHSRQLHRLGNCFLSYVSVLNAETPEFL